MALRPPARVTVTLSWACIAMSSGTLHKCGNTLQHPGTMWASKVFGECIEQSSLFPDDLIMGYRGRPWELPCDIALGVPTVLWSSPRHVQAGSKGSRSSLQKKPTPAERGCLSAAHLTASKVMLVDCRVLSCSDVKRMRGLFWPYISQSRVLILCHVLCIGMSFCMLLNSGLSASGPSFAKEIIMAGHPLIDFVHTSAGSSWLLLLLTSAHLLSEYLAPLSSCHDSHSINTRVCMQQLGNSGTSAPSSASMGRVSNIATLTSMVLVPTTTCNNATGYSTARA